MPAAAAVVVVQINRRWVGQVLLRLPGMAAGAAFMGGLDLGIDLLQLWPLGSRRWDELNWKRIGLMAAVGAFAGLFSGGLSALHSLLTKAPLMAEGFWMRVMFNASSEAMAEVFAARGPGTRECRARRRWWRGLGVVEGVGEGLRGRRSGSSVDLSKAFGFDGLAELTAGLQALDKQLEGMVPGRSAGREA